MQCNASGTSLIGVAGIETSRVGWNRDKRVGESVVLVWFI